MPKIPAFGIETARRILLTMCALGVAWGAVVVLTGGFSFTIGGVRLSSHSPLNAWLIAAAAAGGGAWLPAREPSRTRAAAFARGLHPARLVALTGALLFIYQWAMARPLWLDEEMIALNVRERGLWDLARGLWLGQSAPFGWLALQRAMVLAFGDGERAMRAVPAVFAVGTVAAAWWIGRRWLAGPAAVLLVLFFAFGQWVSFYSLELKHYSGDIFWALLIPASGTWVVDTARRGGSAMLRHALAWWLLAAIGQFVANGALLVTPGVAVVVTGLLASRCGARQGLVFAAGGLLWLAAFTFHYLVAIRHALTSAYLGEYWAFAMPRAGSGFVDILGWLTAQARPLALKPGGTALWPLFWTLTIAGFVFARRRSLGLLFATVPVSACVLAALRLVPLYERIALWVVPALYVGIALVLDTSIAILRDRAARGLARTSLAVIAALAVAVLGVDVVRRGVNDFHRGRPADSNHRLDDRGAVRWLVQQLRPGDALLATHLALPALWWYGHFPLADSAGAGSQTPARLPILEVRHEGDARACREDRLRTNLAGVRRALVYYGFRFDDVPRGFDDALLQQLGRFGTVTDFRGFAGASRVAIVELHADSSSLASGSQAIPGCVDARPARRW
jgi:hypothetical protein